MRKIRMKLLSLTLALAMLLLALPANLSLADPLPPEPTPAATIDFPAEQLIGLTGNAAYEISFPPGTVEAKTASNKGKINIPNTWFGKTLSIVKKGDGAVTADSAAQSLTIPARPARPAGLTATFVSASGATDGAISGVTTAMEYRLGSTGDFIGITSTPLTGITNGTYEIRIKAVATVDDVPGSFCSPVRSVEVGVMSQEDTPAATIDYVTERLVNLVSGAYYAINGGASVKAGASGIAIAGEWLGTEVQIVKKGTGTTTDSAAQSLTIPARPDRPLGFVAVYANPGLSNGSITGVTDAMEYRLSGASGYTAVTGVSITGLAAGTYQIRYKATASSFRSGNTNVTVGETSSEETPVITINFVNERLAGFIVGEVYAINGEAPQTMDKTWIAIDDTWFGTALSIVKKGNGTTTTDSAAQNLSIPARPAKPVLTKTDETVFGAGGTITGVTSAMQYRYNNGEWIDCTTGPMTAAAGVYLFRFAATDMAFHSANTKLTINAASATPEATPDASVDYAAEKLTGLVAGASYLIDGGATPYVADTEGKLAIDPAWFGTALSIVKKGNGTSTTDSAAQGLTIPARPEAPSGVGKTDETGVDLNNGAITNVTNAMEYKLSDAPAWTPCPGATVTGLAPGTYLVRFKAADSAFASEAASVTVGEFVPVYSLSVAAPAFASVAVGYSPVAAKPITITNTGNWEAIIASVALSNPTHFILSGSGAGVPKGGSITSWTIRPANNLSEGTYTTSVIVTYNGGKIATAQVSFTVGSLYPQKTLTDYYSGIAVSGNINAYSELVVNKLSTLHEKCAACDAVRKALANSALKYIYGVEIRLTQGFIGDLTVSLPVGAQYEGETVTICCCSNGEYKTYTAKVQYGRAVFTVRSLSLFAVFVPSGKLTPPQTGGADLSWTVLGVCLIALGAALPAFTRRRRERN